VGVQVEHPNQQQGGQDDQGEEEELGLPEEEEADEHSNQLINEAS